MVPLASTNTSSPSGILKEPLAKRLMAQLIDGLGYCHSCGVCHRDLKVPGAIQKSKNPSIIRPCYGYEWRDGYTVWLNLNTDDTPESVSDPHTHTRARAHSLKICCWTKRATSKSLISVCIRIGREGSVFTTPVCRRPGQLHRADRRALHAVRVPVLRGARGAVV